MHFWWQNCFGDFLCSRRGGSDLTVCIPITMVVLRLSRPWGGGGGAVRVDIAKLSRVVFSDANPVLRGAFSCSCCRCRFNRDMTSNCN
jgi:hypothetical protein